MAAARRLRFSAAMFSHVMSGCRRFGFDAYIIVSVTLDMFRTSCRAHFSGRCQMPSHETRLKKLAIRSSEALPAAGGLPLPRRPHVATLTVDRGN